MEITAKQVKELRERSGAGMMECKAALVGASGDMEKAYELLRKQNKVKAASKSGRVAAEGLVHAYIHPGGRIGVLVEINCETDFAANSDPFKQLVVDVAMHIAATDPRYLAREEVSPAEIEAEREIYKAQVADSGKPEAAVAKIIDSKLEKFYAENCLLEQPFVKDASMTVRDLVEQTSGKIGENVRVRRFTRYKLGEGVAKT